MARHLPRTEYWSTEVHFTSILDGVYSEYIVRTCNKQNQQCILAVLVSYGNLLLVMYRRNIYSEQVIREGIQA
jgi:hypothetical protein